MRGRTVNGWRPPVVALSRAPIWLADVAADTGASPHAKLLRARLWACVALSAPARSACSRSSRGETINAGWLLTAAVCTYAIAYRFYSKIIAAKIFALDANRATPAERLDDGRDFVPTNKWIVFGQPLRGHRRARARSSGRRSPRSSDSCPGVIWIVVGVALGGAVQDFVILCASMRRDGKSLGQMAKEEIGPVAGFTALVAMFGIMIVLHRRARADRRERAASRARGAR